MPASTIMRRHAQALITFVGFGFKPTTATTSESSAEKETLNTLVSTLITLASLQGSGTPETRVDEISQAARGSLNRLLGVLPAVDFIDASLSMIETNDYNVSWLISSEIYLFMFIARSVKGHLTFWANVYLFFRTKFAKRPFPSSIKYSHSSGRSCPCRTVDRFAYLP